MKEYTLIFLLLVILLSACAGSTKSADPVDSLIAEGLFVGRPDGSFDGKAILTRSEVAVLIVRLVNGVDFQPTDDANDHWGHKWVSEAIALGYMETDALGNLDEPATRNDIAVLLYLRGK